MKTLKRITSGIFARFERVVGELENHDALALAAITEAEQLAAKAKAQLWQVKRDGATMQKKLDDLSQQAALWEDRARRSRSVDEERALECVRRWKRYMEQRGRIDEQLRSHRKLEKQLEVELSTVEEKIASLRQQRNMMRTRESRAEAFRITQGVESSFASDIDNIFERWESRLIVAEQGRAEMNSFTDDSFEDSFTSEEEKRELRRLLDSLDSKDADVPLSGGEGLIVEGEHDELSERGQEHSE